MMGNGSELTQVPERIIVSKEVFLRVFGRSRLRAAFACILLIIIAMAIFAPILSTHDPSRINLSRDSIKQSPSAAHFMGTDHLGRDLWSRMIYGARTSLMVGFIAMIIAVIFGTAYGAASGYFGGWIDLIMMTLLNIFLSIPMIFPLIVLAVFIKPSSAGIAMIIGLTSWMQVARLVRGEFLKIKELEFIEASRALGFSHSRIILFHILPNIIPLIIVSATLTFSSAILSESVLGFLGLGIQPPQYSWGSMLSSAQDLILIKEAPWLIFFPGIAIFLTALSLNYIGEGLRDACNVK